MMNRYRQLTPGDHAPWFRQLSSSSPDFHFDIAAGRYVLLCFFLSAADDLGREMAATMQVLQRHCDDQTLTCFGVSIDPADREGDRVRPELPGRRLFWDFDGRVSRLYGALPSEGEVVIRGGCLAPPSPGSTAALAVPEAMRRRFWLLLNPNLQVRAVLPARPAAAARQQLQQLLAGLPAPAAYAGTPLQAPVLLIPDVLEPQLCARLIERYEQQGGVDSGFMRERDGRTVGEYDYAHKRRSDYTIEDPGLQALLRQRVVRRALPLIERAYHIQVTRMERYIVACYDSEVGGHFRAHRDNTTPATAHRQFAMSVNLNSDYEGAEISFPEFSSQTYRPPLGAGLVFSGSLLHQVAPVSRGRRYVFLPFLYDEAAAARRAALQGERAETGAGLPPA